MGPPRQDIGDVTGHDVGPRLDLGLQLQPPLLFARRAAVVAVVALLATLPAHVLRPGAELGRMAIALEADDLEAQLRTSGSAHFE